MIVNILFERTQEKPQEVHSTEPVADLGGCSWGNCPVGGNCTDENSAWRPLFTEKCAPRRYPMTLLFEFCDQNVGQM